MFKVIKIGVLIVAEKPPAGADYTTWKVHRATSKTGDYSVINGDVGQAVTDLSYYDTTGTATHWYKVSYYKAEGSVESVLSDALRGISETYTTVRHVQDLLGMTTLDDTTTPTIQRVVALINRKEDRIDYKTGNAWRERFSGTKSGQDMTAKYVYYDVMGNYERQSGIPVYLENRNIRTFSESEGDVIEIWDGSSYVDWVANKTEGRAEDYWVDYAQGILYIRSRFSVVGPVKLRTKYRYGEDVLNKLVEDLCTKMVAIDLLASDSRSVILAEGSATLKHRDKIAMWKEENDEDLASLKEFQVLPTIF